MKLSPSGLLEHSRTEDGRKQLRYALISVVFVPLGQILIQVLAHYVLPSHSTMVGHPPHAKVIYEYTWASILSAMILTFPNLFANKRWVWRDVESDNLRTQILVFWVAALFGVALATGLTALATHALKTTASDAVVSKVVFLAQLVGFGIVWVIRYLILDKWLFKVTHDGQEPTEAELDELHHDFPI